MPIQHIITGQKIDPVKLQQAKASRRNMTPAEKRLWSALRANRLDGFHFRRQQIIDGFIVDFYCHAASLVVEVDGPVHNGQIEYDVERDRVLSARELQILRVNNEEVMQNLEGVLTRIRAACHTGVDLTPRPPSLPGKGGTPRTAPGKGQGRKTPLPTPGKEARGERPPSPHRRKAKGERPPSPRRGGAGGGVP